MEAFLARLDEGAEPWVVDRVGLQTQEARDDLQVVLDPVGHLPQQEVFLLQRGPQLRLGLFAGGDVQVRGYCQNSRHLGVWECIV